MQKVTGIALALVLGIGAAGCAGSDESAGGGEQVTLTLAVQAGAGNQAAYEKAIADFEAEEPDITIEPEFVGGDWSTLITTQLRGGNAPDLIDLVPGSSVPHSVLAMAKAGFLEDLAGEGWVGELAEGTRPLVSEDDAVYAWPSVVQVSGLFVNEEALSEAGVDVPTTTDELLAACQDLAEAGLTPISWNGMPVTRNGSQATTISSVTGAADPGVIEAIASGEKTFEDSREWLAAFGLIRSLSEGGCFGDGAAVATDEAANADVLGGDAAMSISNSQQAGQILQRGGGGVDLNAYPDRKSVV